MIEENFETERLWQKYLSAKTDKQRSKYASKVLAHIRNDNAIAPKEDLVRYVKYMYRAERIARDNNFNVSDEEVANLKLGGWNLLKFIAQHTDFNVHAIAEEVCEAYDLEKEEYLDAFFTKPSQD